MIFDDDEAVEDDEEEDLGQTVNPDTYEEGDEEKK